MKEDEDYDDNAKCITKHLIKLQVAEELSTDVTDAVLKDEIKPYLKDADDACEKVRNVSLLERILIAVLPDDSEEE